MVSITSKDETQHSSATVLDDDESCKRTRSTSSSSSTLFVEEEQILLAPDAISSLDESVQNCVVCKQINQLPLHLLEIVWVAASLGTKKVDLDILSKACNESAPVDELRESMKELYLGMLVDDRNLSFVEESSHETIYSLIPKEERSMRHYRIGRRLWKKLNLGQLDAYIFLVVDQLLFGNTCIPSRIERLGVARLCLQAGERAVQHSDFETAYEYFVEGISLMGPDRWQIEYDLCLFLHSGVVEVAYCTGRFDLVNNLIDDTIQNARYYSDTIRVRTTKIYTLGSSGAPLDALEYGHTMLAKLGTKLPKNPSQTYVAMKMIRLARRLKTKSNGCILRLPLMDAASDTNNTNLAVMRILNVLFGYSFVAKRELAPLFAELMINMTLDHGLNVVSCVGFGLYGTLLIWNGRFDEGYRYGTLAMRLCERFKVKQWYGRIAAMYYSTVFNWKHPFRDSLEPLKDAYQISLDSGDIEFAMMNAVAYCLTKLDLAPIPELVSDFCEYIDAMRNYGQDTNVTLTQPAIYFLLQMSGQDGGDFAALRKSVMNVEDFHKMQETNIGVFEWGCYVRMQVSYMFGNYDEAAMHANRCQKVINKPLGCGDVAVAPFYDGLVALAMARKAKNGVTKSRWLRRAARRSRRLKAWSIHAPCNFLGKKYLLEAELDAVQGKSTAYPKYVSALSLSKGFHMQSALVLERTAKYFLFNMRDADTAAPLFDQALSAYRAWGGDAKADSLFSELNPSSCKH